MIWIESADEEFFFTNKKLESLPLVNKAAHVGENPVFELHCDALINDVYCIQIVRDLAE